MIELGLVADVFAAGSVPAATRAATERLRHDSAGALAVEPPSALAEDRLIAGPGGPLRLRVLRPAGEVRAGYLHVHGGGWALGGPDRQDATLSRFAAAARVAVVAVGYRLTPRHPHPAGVADCVAALRWMVAQGERELGAGRVIAGGESAGAHLAVLAVLALRDRGEAAPVCAANLAYGVYDVSMTPSARRWGDERIVVNTPDLACFASQYAPAERRRDPDVSPLYADLSGMPPALFTCGTLDPLLDDTLFMAARWRAAGRPAQLDLHPGAPHEFLNLRDPIPAAAEARGRMVRVRRARARDVSTMGVPTTEQYAAMLDAAAAGGYAYPAINVTSSVALNAAIRGFAEAGSDGIVELTTGAAAYLAGASGDAVRGARALAAFAHEVAAAYPVAVALHTDHCPPAQVDGFLRPLLAESAARRRRGERPLFNSQMFDGSTLPLEENLRRSSELLDVCRAAGVVLELECGVVGGEEDAVSAAGVPAERLYTTSGDLLRVAEALGAGERGRYLLAATFGNVHGVHAPGRVELRPEILRDGPGGARRRAAGRALRLRVPWQQRLERRRHPRGDRLRRGQDQPRLRRPVRADAGDRRSRARALRRGPEGRRRRRRQARVRPARLGRPGRGGDGRARHRGVRAVRLGRPLAERLSRRSAAARLLGRDDAQPLHARVGGVGGLVQERPRRVERELVAAAVLGGGPLDVRDPLAERARVVTGSPRATRWRFAASAWSRNHRSCSSGRSG